MKAIRYILATVVLAGCGAPKQHMLTERDYAPVRSAEQVRLFAGNTERETVDIAVVDSFASGDRSSAMRQSQLRDLRKRAAEAGASAVVDVRVLEERHRGMVADPSVPLPAWKQGNSTLYFVRGTAVRFVEDQDVQEWEEQQAGLVKADPADATTEDSAVRIPEVGAPDTERDARPSVRPGY